MQNCHECKTELIRFPEGESKKILDVAMYYYDKAYATREGGRE